MCATKAGIRLSMSNRAHTEERDRAPRLLLICASDRQTSLGIGNTWTNVSFVSVWGGYAHFKYVGGGILIRNGAAVVPERVSWRTQLDTLDRVVRGYQYQKEMDTAIGFVGWSLRTSEAKGL